MNLVNIFIIVVCCFYLKLLVLMLFLFLFLEVLNVRIDMIMVSLFNDFKIIEWFKLDVLKVNKNIID